MKSQATQKQQPSKTKTSVKMFLALSLLVGGAGACATDVDLDETFSEIAAHPILLPASGTGQAREVMSTFDPLMVTLFDTYGQPVAGATVTFTAPVTGATSTFRFGGDVQTDSQGRAEIRPYANSIAGTYIIWAHADGADPMPFVLTNSAAAPAVLEPVVGTNQGTTLGMPFPYPLTVAVRDNYGNAVEGAPVQFLAPTSGPSTNMTQGGNTVTDDEGRAAVFATAGMDAGTYTVTAKVTGAPSITFTLSNVTHQILPNVEALQNVQFHSNTKTLAP